MKIDMRLALRLLAPLGSIVGLLSACSSTTDNEWKIPAPPGGSGSVIPQAGSPATGGGGSGGAGGMSGGSGGAGGGAMGTVKPGDPCTATPECMGTGFKCDVKTKVCDCAIDVPDVCGMDQDAVCTSKMTDPDNCGTCGTKCDAGAVCVAGKCGAKPTDVVTATGCGGGVRLATDGKNIYWTEVTTGKVRSVPISGGAISEVANGMMPGQIAVDSSGVYWTDKGTPGKVFKKALSAAPMLAPTQLAAGTTEVFGLTVHEGIVYYSETTNVHQATLNAGGDAVMTDIKVGISVNYDGGKMEVVGNPIGIAASDDHVVWTTPGDRNAVESHTLVAVTNATDNMVGYGKLGKSVGELLPSGDCALDATYGYWANGERFDRDELTAQDGISVTITTAPNSHKFTAFTVGGAKMYGSTDMGEVITHSLTPPPDPANDTVPAVLVARDQMNVTSMVNDGTNVYWVTTDCIIRSMPF